MRLGGVQFRSDEVDPQWTRRISKKAERLRKPNPNVFSLIARGEELVLPNLGLELLCHSSPSISGSEVWRKAAANPLGDIPCAVPAFQSRRVANDLDTAPTSNSLESIQ
jgi:hypothetical protein